jgi:hypothetical protein
MRILPGGCYKPALLRRAIALKAPISSEQIAEVINDLCVNAIALPIHHIPREDGALPAMRPIPGIRKKFSEYQYHSHQSQGCPLFPLQTTSSFCRHACFLYFFGDIDG